MSNKAPIGKRLKEARIAAEISQKKLGIAAGMDEFVASARMNQYETGKHTPDYTILHRIADALKVPTPYFYTQDNQLAELIKAYGKLKKAQKIKLLTFLETLIP